MLDVIDEKMENARSEPNLEIITNEPVIDFEEDSEENKENFAPDGFDDKNIKYVFILFI